MDNAPNLGATAPKKGASGVTSPLAEALFAKTRLGVLALPCGPCGEPDYQVCGLAIARPLAS
jgi:hypothetical protein